jgi:hypothetical protein
MSEIVEHTLTPEEMAVPRWATDRALSPTQVAQREVMTLGLAKACFKWATVCGPESKNERYGAILTAISTIAYDTDPPNGLDPVYVVSLLDADQGKRIWDAIITDAPNGTMAMAAAAMEAIERKVVSPNGPWLFTVAKADAFHTLEIRRRTTLTNDDTIVSVSTVEIDGEE